MSPWRSLSGSSAPNRAPAGAPEGAREAALSPPGALRLGRRALVGRGLGLCAASLLVGPLGSACYGAPASAPLASAPADWNERQVAWVPYAEGLAAGRARRQPILLIFYTDWCPHCHNYSRLFHDPELARLSQRFVMIRVERDGHRDISRVYDIDGEYIPRTFFLSPTGVVLTDLASDNDEYRYFLDEHDPAMLMSLMQSALERLGVAPIERRGRGHGGE